MRKQPIDEIFLSPGCRASVFINGCFKKKTTRRDSAATLRIRFRVRVCVWLLFPLHCSLSQRQTPWAACMCVLLTLGALLAPASTHYAGVRASIKGSFIAVSVQNFAKQLPGSATKTTMMRIAYFVITLCAVVFGKSAPMRVVRCTRRGSCVRKVVFINRCLQGNWTLGVMRTH